MEYQVPATRRRVKQKVKCFLPHGCHLRTPPPWPRHQPLLTVGRGWGRVFSAAYKKVIYVCVLESMVSSLTPPPQPVERGGEDGCAPSGREAPAVHRAPPSPLPGGGRGWVAPQVALWLGREERGNGLFLAAPPRLRWWLSGPSHSVGWAGWLSLGPSGLSCFCFCSPVPRPGDRDRSQLWSQPGVRGACMSPPGALI